jgi:universal stress protein E
MAAAHNGFQNVLVATDFSPSANAALQLATWLGRASGAKLVLAHVLEDLQRAVHSLGSASKLDLLTAEGEIFEKEIRQKSDVRLQQRIAALHANDLSIRYETLLGEPFVELIHAVQQEGYDLLMLGTRGMSAWKQFFVGSTAKRLIRKCPSAVWIVKAEHATPPSKSGSSQLVAGGNCQRRAAPGPCDRHEGRADQSLEGHAAGWLTP